jgi:hypothetical protein
MNKYIEELLTEMEFDFRDLAFGLTYKDIGYATKKEFYDEMIDKLLQLEFRLKKEA